MVGLYFMGLTFKYPGVYFVGMGLMQPCLGELGDGDFQQNNLAKASRNDLPSLVVSFVPLPNNNGSAIVNTAMVFVTMTGIEIEAYVVNHPHCSITIAQVLALGPQYRLIKNIWIVRCQLHLQNSFCRPYQC